MKKQLLLPIAALLFLFACKEETKKETLAPDTDKVGALKSLQKKTQAEIAGLWKLYKTIDASGYSYNEERNEYLNIRNNNTFEERGDEGIWIVSYGLVDSTQTKAGTFFIKIYNPNTTNPDTYTYAISKKEEGGTTYLITMNMDDLKQKYYIRQQ